MKPSLLFCALSLYSLASIAQNTFPSQTYGYVNFSLESSSIQPQKGHRHQGITLFACNTIITNDSVEHWKGNPKGLEWNKNNQVFSNMPYGYQLDKKTNAPYYVSKYYIASPPVFHANQKDKSTTKTLYDIGIVTPDEFVFKGDKPVQKVYMDYDVLRLMYIEYIPVEFDASFDLWKVDIVPFKVECIDFHWLEKESYDGAMGASGIGYLDRNTASLKKLFLPFYKIEDMEYTETSYLDCEVTILNDILFHHEIFFIINGEKKRSINLKEFYELYHTDENMKITLHCEYRDELPCGCKEPGLK